MTQPTPCYCGRPRTVAPTEPCPSCGERLDVPNVVGSVEHDRKQAKKAETFLRVTLAASIRDETTS